MVLSSSVHTLLAEFITVVTTETETCVAAGCTTGVLTPVTAITTCFDVLLGLID